ncbi:polymorphic toxin-type HINT domain-containing protein, partial [Ruminococcus bicirculans (ex Wegman et al. 2014)]
MATIELYKSKINNMSNYINQAKSAVGDFCVDLSALKSKVLGINSSVCDSVVTSISTSSQTQEQQIAGLEATQREVDEFINLTVNRDNSASSEISRSKKDFYKQYSYLKPDCEKTDWEKFCEGLKKVGQWCKDHWKEIVLVIEIVAAVVCLCVPGLQGIGTGILIGALKGALTGGLIGGITSMLTGGSFLEGFAQGALDGAIMGGALGGVGGIAGKFITCGSKLGNAIQTTSKISGAISNSMDGFDMVSLGLGMVDPNNPITELNNKMHQSDVYNNFQMGVSLLSAFSGAAADNMACFIAGTLVLTTAGLLAIEKLNPGDKVISTDPDTLETSEKTVLETYIRKVDRLVHLVINGEEIVTTDNHPFYVQDRGFIEAGRLLVDDKLVSVNGDDLFVEYVKTEELDTLIDVHNFQVEDFHTYFVGNLLAWVHNKTCPPHMNEDGTLKPNQEYKAGENGYTYKTDANGNISSAHADELKFKTHDGRLNHNSNTAGKLPGDDAGHLFADQFGGSPELDNLVSQKSGLNRGIKGNP